MDSWRSALARGIFLIVTIETLVSVPYLSWELAIGNRQRLGILFSLSSAGAVIIIAWRWRNFWKRLVDVFIGRLSRVSSGRWLLLCFTLGALLRILWVWQFPAPQRSDQATYFALARNLVENHMYGIPNGGLAYWPPGYPFFLSLWFFLFGFKAWVPLLANLFLFAGTLVAVDRLGRRIGGTPVARLATLLLVPWPTMVMIVGLAGKELLVVLLLCLVLLTYCDREGKPAREFLSGRLVLSGLLLGIAILTQPSFQLFPLVLLVYEYFSSHTWGRAALRLITVTMVLCAVIFPWTLRNHRVLGAWVPISTNGGDVLYRANNPWATGGYTPRGEQSLEGLDEVERGREGSRLAEQWIVANPRKFLALALRKQLLFLGDDAQGAFETLKRGLEIEGLRYVAWKGISNFYWWFLWSLIFLALITAWRRARSEEGLHAALIFAVLYLFAIHSVFESGSKYHEPLMAFLAILAAQVAAPRISLSQSQSEVDMAIQQLRS